MLGEYAFDYANVFCNRNHKTVADPRRFRRRLEIVTKAAHLDRNRMLRWILAWGGLSAAWKINDNIPPDTPLRVAELAAAELRLEVEYSTRIEGPFNMQGPVGSVLHPVPVFDGRRGAICREALESLPEWFGIPASVESYVAAADELPMRACFDP